jgi:hypothetical protein
MLALVSIANDHNSYYSATILTKSLFLFSYPDVVIYLLNTTSFATLEEVKNYKSLQSYKYFISATFAG